MSKTLRFMIMILLALISLLLGVYTLSINQPGAFFVLVLFSFSCIYAVFYED